LFLGEYEECGLVASALEEVEGLAAGEECREEEEGEGGTNV
jgi:hypothetical protein